MNILNELSTMSHDGRRLELARLLAIGVIRVLTKRFALPLEDEKESAKNFPKGLEES